MKRNMFGQLLPFKRKKTGAAAFYALLIASLWVGFASAKTNPVDPGSDSDAALAASPECPRNIDSTNCDRCHGGGLPAVDRKRFEESVHFKKAGMNCDSCHGGGGSFPHENDSPPSCLDCHSDEEFKNISKSASHSIHCLVNPKTVECFRCHSAHYAKKAKDMTREERISMCSPCHQLDRLAVVHRWHPLAALHLQNTACIACHTKPEFGVADIAFKHHILKKGEASRECEDCHSASGKMLRYVETLGEKPRIDMTQNDMLRNFYMGGATKVEWIDIGGLILIAAAVLGALLHSLARAAARKGRSQHAQR